MKSILIALILMVSITAKSQEIALTVSKKYLNLPISTKTERAKMSFTFNGKPILNFNIRLATGEPDYWVFYDLSKYKGQTLEINYTGNPSGLKKVYQDERIAGQDSMYKEVNRPQIHFSTRRGWINDPNGMIYLDGEYHLFYQHNPYETDWENMHWGHAISKDLVHWKELPTALFPDSIGTMFSGSALVDHKNTSGFGKDGIAPMVAVYTAPPVQCLAYSLDKGQTFTKYKENPVLKGRGDRDPHVFWYEPGKHWVMSLYENSGMAIYTSKDLKQWNYESQTSGFYECPQFFELPIDGNKSNKKWVLYGASGVYMIGTFNGKAFTPESGKYRYINGNVYAAQTFANIPNSDGRRIQMGWGQITHPGMPFKGMMTLPTELTLRSTNDGIRLFSYPVKEIDALQEKEYCWENIDPKKGTEFLQQFNNAAALRIKLTLKITHPDKVKLSLNGQEIFSYFLSWSKVNDQFYFPNDITSKEITADIIIDKTSAEVFIDGGAYSFVLQRDVNSKNKTGFQFSPEWCEIKSLKVYPMKSIWE